jgi:hypothetical protein
MNRFALETVLELVNNEMGALDNVLASPQDELSEESLLEIKWKEMADHIHKTAPTTWSLLHQTAFVPRQEAQNKLKRPDMVHYVSSKLSPHVTD